MTSPAAFWDRIAPRYAKRPIANLPAYEATLARVKSYLKPADRVLELGCGTGSTALILAPGVAAYTGADISAEMVRIGRGKAEAAGQSQPEFVQAGVDAEAFRGSAFDVVLAFNLFHLVPGADVGLGEVARLVPSGGLFISKTPCLSGKWYLRPVIGILQSIGMAPPVRFLSPNDWERRIEAARFDILETGYYPSPSRFVVARKR